jgi:hypothetical protein
MLAIAIVVVAGVGLGACGDDDDTSVAFASPKDGAEVSSPVTVEMTANGITIEPAGAVKDNAGHFHVLVDVGCKDAGETIPVDTPGYNHFGKAQTSAELPLDPGEHKLCLQVGDGVHTALDETDEITITVK